MAKTIAYSTLKLKVNTPEVKTITIEDKEIEVKQYLPVNEKLNVIAAVLNGSVDQNNFMNPVKVEVVGAIEIIDAYTNLTFTDKQKEDIDKLYDTLETNGVIDAIVSVIPELEYKTVLDGINDTIEAYYKYQNSVYGIMDGIVNKYKDTSMDLTALQDAMANPENLTLLKDVVTKLG